MASHRRPTAFASALAETARFYPLCVLTVFVLTSLILWSIGGFSPRLSTDRFLAAVPAAFGALAGALACQGRSSRMRLIAHAAGFAIGLAGGFWSVIQGNELAVPLFILLSYLAATLAVGRAAGGGPIGFWRGNVIGLTGLAIGLIVACVGLAGIGIVTYALKALLDVSGEHTMVFSLFIGFCFVCPIIALAALRPVALTEAGRPAPGFVAVLATVADALLIPVMIALALVIHVYASTILLKAALPRGEIGAITTTYLVAGYGVYLLIDGLPVSFGRLRKAFRLAWVPSTAVPLVLLGLATFARIEQYGITEERYGLTLVVTAGTIFLAAALLRRPLDIRIVPFAAAILAGTAMAGPLGATATMVRSQVARAQAVLAAVPPDAWDAKGPLALSGNQRETLLAVMEILDNRSMLPALTEAPSWPAALPRTRAGLSTERQPPAVPRSVSTQTRLVDVGWQVYPLPTSTLIPLFNVSVPSQDTLNSPSGRWVIIARDNRLIVNEDGRETVFDLSNIPRDRPAMGARTVVTVPSESGPGTLVLQAYDVSTGEIGPVLTRIRGSILLQDEPAGSAR